MNTADPTNTTGPIHTPEPTVRRFDVICLIFNPHSTGDAPQLAATLRDQLAQDLPYSPQIRMLPTEHAGHAVDLAREAASTPNALVVSVSGDGGYHEVVNGVMAAGSTDTVCAVLPAGNANDHHRTTARQPLAEAIAEGQVRQMDLLHLSTGNHPGAQALYAHSYIGFGLTPVVAIDMEKGNKGALKEMISVVRTFAKFRPFRIQHTDGTRQKIDSLVFANIPQMAKHATLSEAEDRPADGRFEVILFPHTAKWRVLVKAARATTTGLGDQPSVAHYEFTTLKPMPYQLDGEVRSVPANTTVCVESAPGALTVIG
ncbi:diacylglycerol kinase family protein [Kocuria sp. CPCC 205258]|uniref:diacylglycerol kinase family protein n=1 Tax=Kocuria sp. CPCC 205258 TaxID=3073552 RepID=UPI0034D53F98